MLTFSNAIKVKCFLGSYEWEAEKGKNWERTRWEEKQRRVRFNLISDNVPKKKEHITITVHCKTNQNSRYSYLYTRLKIRDRIKKKKVNLYGHVKNQNLMHQNGCEHKPSEQNKTKKNTPPTQHSASLERIVLFLKTNQTLWEIPKENWLTYANNLLQFRRYSFRNMKLLCRSCVVANHMHVCNVSSLIKGRAYTDIHRYDISLTSQV